MSGEDGTRTLVDEERACRGDGERAGVFLLPSLCLAFFFGLCAAFGKRNAGYGWGEGEGGEGINQVLHFFLFLCFLLDV